ncbi:MAG TPA: hypothetical protein VNZ48_19410 [Xanthobacteraceae bacterium]|nr:hypothetical protein [Xanthobacteraceae bacterium]
MKIEPRAAGSKPFIWTIIDPKGAYLKRSKESYRSRREAQQAGQTVLERLLSDPK